MLHSSFITTHVYNDTKYSVLFMTLQPSSTLYRELSVQDECAKERGLRSTPQTARWFAVRFLCAAVVLRPCKVTFKANITACAVLQQQDYSTFAALSNVSVNGCCLDRLNQFLR
jgi:hypothetical protein